MLPVPSLLTHSAAAKLTDPADRRRAARPRRPTAPSDRRRADRPRRPTAAEPTHRADRDRLVSTSISKSVEVVKTGPSNFRSCSYGGCE